MVTLIYTSGTTGFPKGVMLSHKNLVTNFISTSKAHALDHRHRVLSFLPLSHVYERMVNYHFQYKGMSIYYAENMGTIIQDVNDVKPDIFNSVPRLLERVYDRIIGKGKDLKGISKRIFFWAVNLGTEIQSAWEFSLVQPATSNCRQAGFQQMEKRSGTKTSDHCFGGCCPSITAGTYFLGRRNQSHGRLWAY